MSDNKHLRKAFQSKEARFYMADFHVHSPASFDVRTGDRFSALPPEDQEKIKEIPLGLANNPVAYEAEVMNKYPPHEYYESILNQREKISKEIGISGDWAMLAITDHNVCSYSCKVATHAWENRSSNKLIVLPGIELSITYPLADITARAGAHVLCIFAPNTTESDIRLAIQSASNVSPAWEFGKSIDLDSLPEFINKLRLNSDYPAICIAAHVSSSSGVQSETRKVVLSQMDVAISRVKGEMVEGKESNIEELYEKLRQLESERDEEKGIALQVLYLVGQCGFDALQVSSKEEEIHYRQLHRFREHLGRAVPIVCSDAHSPNDIYRANGSVPHLKLPNISSTLDPKPLFIQIIHALRLGETRFSYISPDDPIYWISGIEITPDAQDSSKFWPFSTQNVGQKSFRIALSQNLNCFIGGRGSGKSAALESLAFLTKPSDFTSRSAISPKNPSDYYERTKATLNGCHVKLCWQFTTQEKSKAFPKNAVFASGYFSQNDRHPTVEYQNIDGTIILSEQIPEHQIQYYRLGEIEVQTKPNHLRTLFDEICGDQIVHYNNKINDLLIQLQQQRREIVSLSQKISDITQEDSPLQHYAQRKKLFEEINTSRIKEAYEEIDKTTEAMAHVEGAQEDWENIQKDFNLTDRGMQVDTFFDELYQRSTDKDKNPIMYQENLSILSQPLTSESQEIVPKQLVKNSIIALSQNLNEIKESLNICSSQISKQDVEAKNKLVPHGLPTGSKDREAKKAAFDASEKALDDYRYLIQRWEEMNEDRKNYCSDLMKITTARTALRCATADSITKQLRRDLDSSILVIEANVAENADKGTFINWLEKNFSAQSFQYKQPRIKALIAKSLTPEMLRNLFLSEGKQDISILYVETEFAKHGAISSEVATGIFERCVGRFRQESEVDTGNWNADFTDELPTEIKEGLYTFPRIEKGSMKLQVEEVLKLDEIVFDDIPEIKLNDRPKDRNSILRPINKLSPGQRCSAMLPILLLTGNSPIIIDQPEDNMDNRLIRQVIVNILSGMKLKRQVILATHNANIPVLGDVEQAYILQAIGEKECEVWASGDLDSDEVVHNLTEVMEGGREAFQYRQSIYQAHWPGPVSLPK